MASQLPDPGQESKVTIEGPAGAIEARVAMPPEPAEPQGCAIVCHPHPLFGGTMDNKVAYTLSRVLQRAGYVTMRFNFRGVGSSEGEHDEGRGEQDDARSVLDWVRRESGLETAVVAGFSFGAYVAWQIADKTPPTALVTIAPPVRYFSEQSVAPGRPGCEWLVVQGDADEVVDCDSVIDVVSALEPPPRVVKLEAVGHFFHGHLGDLRDHVSEFLDGIARR